MLSELSHMHIIILTLIPLLCQYLGGASTVTHCWEEQPYIRRPNEQCHLNLPKNKSFIQIAVVSIK